MSVEIRKIDQLTEDQLGVMHSWQCDPSIRHLFNVYQSATEYEKTDSIDVLKAELEAVQGHRYGLFEGEAFVGEFNFVFDHPALIKRLPKSAWVGIGIGEKKARGRGLGVLAMQFLEKEIKNQGGCRIELGVF